MPNVKVAERRANPARLSLFLFVASIIGIFVYGVPTAHAEPPPQIAVTVTSPSSTPTEPANSTTPFVFSGEGESTTTVVRPRWVGTFAVTADLNPANEVSIYATPTCAGTPLGIGTLAQFEKGTGIQVEVPADQVTTFYATETEAGETSECSSKGFPYYESSTVVTPPKEELPTGGSGDGTTSPSGSMPPPAPRIHTVPGGRANDNTPLLAGSGPGATSVRVFATANCAGPAVAKGSAGDFAAGLAVQVADNTASIFSAYSLAGGNQSPCSNSVTYVEDSRPPHTRITMAPGVKTRRHKAVFRFTDTTEDPPGTTFLCKVDGHKWRQCSSPLHLRHLGFKRHVVRVKAIDTAGNAEATGAKRRFQVIHGL
jgi:hypothetical protein